MLFKYMNLRPTKVELINRYGSIVNEGIFLKHPVPEQLFFRCLLPLFTNYT